MVMSVLLPGAHRHDKRSKQEIPVSSFLRNSPPRRVTIQDGNAGADQVTLLGVAIADLNAGNVELDDQPTGV